MRELDDQKGVEGVFFGQAKGKRDDQKVRDQRISFFLEETMTEGSGFWGLEKKPQ